MKQILILMALGSSMAIACTVTTDGKTIKTCKPTQTHATIADLRDAIASGATTAGEMAGL